MMSLKALAQCMGAHYEGDDQPFNGLSKDTRTLMPGELYVALVGEQFDGHDFIPQALEKGAGALLVQQPIEAPCPVLTVKDTLKGLGALGQAWRMQFDIPVAAVTGSRGKTTVKNFLYQIFLQRGLAYATPGNYNNDIGVPYSLSQLKPAHTAAIFELGANHVGEIRYTVACVKPQVVILNNAGASHLEGFGGIEGVVRAKGEILEGVRSGGVAVLNRDDPHYSVWAGMCSSQTQCMSFGASSQADVRVTDVNTGADGVGFKLITPQGHCFIQLQLLGEHNAFNAAAAAAAALAMGFSLDDIRHGLSETEAEARRLVKTQGAHGAIVLDDTYNASVESVLSALDVLGQFPGQHIAVLGEMRELGDDALQYHRTVGEHAREVGVTHLFAYGSVMATAMRDAFGKGGQVFSTKEALLDALEPLLSKEAVILVKGARGMTMETIVNALKEEEKAC